MLSYEHADEKQIIITPQAKKYLDDQPEAVQDEFQAHFDTLATDGGDFTTRLLPNFRSDFHFAVKDAGDGTGQGD